MSTQQAFPVFWAFGDLKPEAGRDFTAMTPGERLRAVWPYIVGRVNAFDARLRPRERANYDREDVATHLAARLLEKDHEWRPERGKYITFAAKLIEHELCEIRDKARTVPSPRNASCRMREYEAEEQAGTISPRRQKTANDIRRTMGGIQAIAPENSSEPGLVSIDEPTEALSGAESADHAARTVRRLVRHLSCFEALVLSRSNGLRRKGRESLGDIAADLGCEYEAVREARARAIRIIRQHLNEESAN